MAINNGGPAFPRPRSVHEGQHGKTVYDAQAGMSLRDYFAAQALAGLLVRWVPDPTNLATAEQGAAIAAYRLADAMLAEHEKGGGA